MMVRDCLTTMVISQGPSGHSEDTHEDPSWHSAVDFSTCFEDVVVVSIPTAFLLLATAIQFSFIPRSGYLLMRPVHSVVCIVVLALRGVAERAVEHPA